jgi:hypothetical protein
MNTAFDFDKLFKALLQQESGGRNIQGPMITAGANAGDRAQGPGQVMPLTAREPGYGVKPLDPNAGDPVAENLRFSQDYLKAMINEFGGDQEAGTIAYNAGPGNAKKWMDAGRDYSALPKRSETEPYVKNIFAMAGRGEGAPMPTAYTSAAPQPAAAASQPAQAPWMKAFDASEESKTPLGLLLKERMAEAPEKGSDWQERLGEMLYKGGQAMTKAGSQPGANVWSSLAQGISGGATGYRDLKQEEKKKKKSSTEALRKLEIEAAKLASPKKSGGVKFSDLMKLVKESGGGYLDTDALRKSSVEYGHQIKDDPFGSAYLQQLVKELAGKAQSGEITDEEKADLESLMKIFEDVQ